jgi:hypothetical protein
LTQVVYLLLLTRLKSLMNFFSGVQ